MQYKDKDKDKMFQRSNIYAVFLKNTWCKDINMKSSCVQSQNTEIHRQRQGQSTFLLSDQPETASVSLTNNLFG